MASFKNDFGLSGKLGDVIIYQIGNKSYARSRKGTLLRLAL